MPAKEIFRIYDAVLSSPGMEDLVRIEIRMSRKNILLISRLIEYGLNGDENTGDDIFSQLFKDKMEEINLIREDLLKKGGLSDFYNKLKSVVS